MKKRDLERIYTPIIELQATWIAINPIQGCPKQCQYCFLKHQNQIGVAPVKLMENDQLIQKLYSYKYYSSEIPLSFFTHTDPLGTPLNTKNLLEILKIFHKEKVPNIKCFITKCPIPEEFAKEIALLISKGEKIIIYISFSGLDSTIERGVNHGKLIDSLQYLTKYNIPVIHYWRPFLPQNSSKETMLRVISIMSKVAKTSVIAGLKLYPQMIDNFDMWSSIKTNFSEIINYEGVWPKGVMDFLYNLPKPYDDYPLFQSNSCAITFVMKQFDIGGFWNSKVCNSYNKCPSQQRQQCSNFHNNFQINKVDIDKILSDYNIDLDYEFITSGGIKKIIVDSKDLSISEIVFLRHKIKGDVIVKRSGDNYWKSSTSGQGPIELDY